MTLKVQDKDNAALKYEKHSILPRTLLGGTKAMREAREKFTPRERGEMSSSGLPGYDDRYEFRLKRCCFLANFYAKTASFLAGQAFGKPIKISDDMPEAITELLDDIDGKGNDINIFFSRVFFRGIAEGSRGVRVDSNVPQERNGSLSVEEARRKGYRPVLIEIKGEDVLGVLGSGEPEQLRISGVETVRDGDYGAKDAPCVLVGTRESWQKFVGSEDGGEYIPQDPYKHGADLIPAAFFTPGENISWALGKPALEDLADLQHQHWLDAGDLKKIIHTAQRPILHLHNIDADVVTAGADFAYTSNDLDNDYRTAPFINYSSVTGEGIEHGRKSLEDLEHKIGLWGLMQLLPQDVAATATEKNLTAGINSSSLAMWVIEFESMLQRVFEIVGQVLGVSVPEKCCELNREFLNVTMMPATDLINAVDAGIIPKELAFAEFKRRRGFVSIATWEDARAMMENERRQVGGTFGPGAI